MKLYNDCASYLKQKYGCRVYRIGLDAGFSCPNRDGTKGTGGCIYCDERGSRSAYTRPGATVREQLAGRIAYLKEKRGAEKFIAYFQAFTNTYAPAAKLKTAYDEILPFKGIVGLSIGTRPDAIDEEKLRLISSYKGRYEVWLEYGLQSSHDRTLRLINRGHIYADFTEAFCLAKKHDILVCAHVIIGLPGETRKDIIETARRLADLKIDGIKIHLLHILKGSALEKLYREGKFRTLDEDEYAGLACDFLENLSKDVIIQRLTGQGTAETHIAPGWALNKANTIAKIEETLKRRGSSQGSKLQRRL